MTVGGIWTTDVQQLKSIGPRRARLLNKLGIFNIGDLLYHFPRDYDDRSRLKPAAACQEGDRVTVTGVVAGGEEKRPRRGLSVTRIFVDEGTSGVVAVWYNQPFIRRQLSPGTRVLVTGTVSRFQNEIRIQVADYEVDDGKRRLNTGRITPLYPLTGGLSQRMIRSIIGGALDQWGDRVQEFIPGDILEKYVLPGIGAALHAIHFPDSPRELMMARRRFVFEDFFLHQVVISLMKKRTKLKPKPHIYSADDRMEQAFLQGLPFRATPGQLEAWREIRKDMLGNFPMNRLLQGDVGSGKTLVCALAMLKAAEKGYQAALMAPTEILAGQHYENICRYCGHLGVSIGRITGGMKKKDREALLAGIRSGQVQMVVGTHAVNQDDVEFKRLALVVIDEQHRFGVRQRAMIREKGQNPDVLVMTATPIPRTLAMTIYGDLDISTVKGMPPGRKPVETRVYSPDRLPLVYGLIKKEVSLGRQAYIICPLVEESEKTDLQAAVELGAYLAGGPLSGCRVDMLHGRMKAVEKEQVMSRFREGAIDVLVSTTVIEVGVDVPNANVMVVLDADRFGLAQLHQLRGRVGRGSHRGLCCLISDARSKEAVYRLNVMETTTDGFVLAEKDLELRGPGELFGTRQSGTYLYRLADPSRDTKALKFAAEEARRLVDEDPGMKKSQNSILIREIGTRFRLLNYLSVG